MSKSRRTQRSRSRRHRRHHGGSTVKPVHATTVHSHAAKVGGRRHRRRHRGGDASTWALQNYGDLNQQTANVQQGNQLTPLSGAPAVLPANANPGLKGGGSRRHHTRRQRGGYWSQVLNQAMVPLSLFGLKKYMDSRRKTKHHSISHPRTRRFSRRH